ncbi:HAD family hydrolase [Candidatus Thorarchaeota archaeon]|nr:MAG: HAD family hydrolase [Candidatus Thorarchaeota archaeon]
MEEKIVCSTVIFDFDGTLADSMPFLESIGVKIMMKYFGVPKEEAAIRYRSTTGLPYEQQIKMNFPEHPKNESAIEEFEQMKIDRIFEQKLFADTEETVRELGKRGINVIVSSSTFQSTIEEYFRRRGILDLFTAILGYRPGFEKGADHFNYIHSVYNIPFEEMVFVGDSLKDYERSKNFCKFIALEDMFTHDDFRRVGHSGPIITCRYEVLAHISNL